MVALKTLIITIIGPGTTVGIIPWLLLLWSGAAVIPYPSIWLLGLLPLLVGGILYFWCAGALTFIGKGTPSPADAPIFLVSSGPYQWVRNPMYSAFFCIVIGEAILFHALLLLGYILLLGIAAHLFVVFSDEPSLRRRFGESYEEYLRTVPRWLPHYPRPQED